MKSRIAWLFKDIGKIRKSKTGAATHWAVFLGKVRTPLGLFAHLGLGTAGILLAVIPRANQENLATIAKGMIAIVLAVILAVFLMYYRKVK